jgi:hypothetical protein
LAPNSFARLPMLRDEHLENPMRERWSRDPNSLAFRVQNLYYSFPQICEKLQLPSGNFEFKLLLYADKSLAILPAAAVIFSFLLAPDSPFLSYQTADWVHLLLVLSLILGGAIHCLLSAACKSALWQGLAEALDLAYRD